MSTTNNIAVPGNILQRLIVRMPFTHRIFQVSIFLSLFSLSFGAGDNAAEGSMTRQLIWGVAGLFSLVQIWLDFYKNGHLNVRFGGAALWCIFIYALCSTIWSIDPMVTFKRSILLSFIMLLCIATTGKKDDKDIDFGQLIALPLLVLLGLSVIATIVLPGLANTSIGWRGATSHKNEMGQLMGILLLLLLYGNLKIQGAMRTCAIVLCVLGLLFSKSSTAMVGVAFAIFITTIVAVPSLLRYTRTWNRAILGVALSCIIVIFVFFIFDALPPPEKIIDGAFHLIGKSSNLTGRTGIWERVLSESRYHNPWLGGGYGAFWVGLSSASGFISRASGVYTGQSHNGYLDIYNDLGYIGIGLLFILLISTVIQLRRVFKLGHREANLLFSIVSMIVVVNYSESTFFRSTQFANLLFIASYIRICVIANNGDFLRK